MSVQQAQQEFAIKEFLKANKWPEGLVEEYLRGLDSTELTYFIVDDSGSMSISDSTRFVKNGAKLVSVSCTRWAELIESMTFHASLANSSRAPAVFRLLNNSAPITIGGPSDDGSNYRKLLSSLELPPSGGTPLCGHIDAVVAEITAMKSKLKATGKKVKLVIATDGEASDGNVAIAMRPLKDLPVHVVLRLCTNDDRVVSYWDQVEADLELAMDSIDDLASEAEGIKKFNPWLNYSEPLQRLRETGATRKELDLLDETSLTGDQIRNMCIVLFGSKYKDIPHPDVDWKKFLKAVKEADDASEHSWAPLTGAVSYHIDKKALAKHLRKGGCIVM